MELIPQALGSVVFCWLIIHVAAPGACEMNFATLGSFEVFFMHLTSLGLDAPFFISDSSGVINEESKKCFNEKEEIPLLYRCKGIKS